MRRGPQRFGSSLALRIVLPLALALVVVFGFAAVVLGRSVRDEGLRELLDRARLLASTVAYNSELPVLARDSRALEALLAGAARDRDIFEASILDEASRQLASSSSRSLPDEPDSQNGARLVVVESPVVTSGDGAGRGEDSAFALDVPAGGGKGREIGRVRLMVSTVSTDHRTQRLQFQIAMAGVGLLVVCLAIGLGIVRVIGRPLRELRDATRRVAAGDLSTRLRATSSDEVGELTRAFNRMTQDLEAARAEVLTERAELERRVVERTSELARAHESLVHSERMSAVGQLVAGVAHELNNPLTVVLGYAGILRKEEPDAGRRRKLDSLLDAAESSRKIVQNLLTFARKQKAEKTAVDVNEIIRRTIELRRYHLRTEKLRVLTELDPSLPRVWADFHQIQQVILNLLVNAEQAMEEAGKGSFVRFSTHGRNGLVGIEVEDDGPGMPAEVRTRVFEPFFTTKAEGRGTGLGLSICYGILADHGGSIEVESQLGRWTRFRISLPIGAGAIVEEPGRSVQPSPVAAADSIRVLVIDDDPSVLDLVVDAFEELPIVIDKALGGRNGIAKLSEGTAYDAILTDMRMPDVDGRAVLRYLQENRPDLAKRLLFATGDVGSPESVAFMDSSGCPVLAKPYSLDALREAVMSLGRGA